MLSAPMSLSSGAVMAAGEGWNDDQTERLFAAARDIGVPLLSEELPHSSLLLGLEYRIASDDSLRLAIARDGGTQATLDRFIELQSGQVDELEELLQAIASVQLRVAGQKLDNLQPRRRENTLMQSARLFRDAAGRMGGPQHIETALREEGFLDNRQVRHLEEADDAIAFIKTLLGTHAPQHWDLIDCLVFVNDEYGLIPGDAAPLNRMLARYTAYETAWYGDKALALIEPLSKQGVELQKILAEMDAGFMTRERARQERDMDRLIEDLKVAVVVAQAYSERPDWIKDMRPWYSEATRDRFMMRLLKGKNIIRRGIEAALGQTP